MKAIKYKYLRNNCLEKEVNLIYEVSDNSDKCFVHDETLFSLRSCIKPIYWSLYYDIFKNELSDDQQTILFSSHNGELEQIKKIVRILNHYKINYEDFDIDRSYPLARGSFFKKKYKILNNSSGFHLAMMLLCKFMGMNNENYLSPNHPIHEKVYDEIFSVLSRNKRDCKYHLDNDSITIPNLNLREMITVYNKLLREETANMTYHNSFFYGGRKRIDTEFNKISPNSLIKEGAEGLVLYHDFKSCKTLGIKLLNGQDDYILKIALKNLLLKYYDIKIDLSESTNMNLSIVEELFGG